MANHEERLELTWIGKVRPELESRVMIADFDPSSM